MVPRKGVRSYLFRDVCVSRRAVRQVGRECRRRRHRRRRRRYRRRGRARVRVQCAASGVFRGFDVLSSSAGFLDRRDQLLLEQLVRRLWKTSLIYRSGGARRCRKQPRVRKHNEEDGLQRGKFRFLAIRYIYIVPSILLSRSVVRFRGLTSRPPNANSNLTSVPAHSWHVINSTPPPSRSFSLSLLFFIPLETPCSPLLCSLCFIVKRSREMDQNPNDPVILSSNVTTRVFFFSVNPFDRTILCYQKYDQCALSFKCKFNSI